MLIRKNFVNILLLGRRVEFIRRLIAVGEYGLGEVSGSQGKTLVTLEEVVVR